MNEMNTKKGARETTLNLHRNAVRILSLPARKQ